MSVNSNKTGQYFWLAFLVLLIGLFSYIFSVKQGSKVTNISPSHLIIDGNSSGHYLIAGTINGFQVNYLLDTGATDVVIPESLALNANLTKGPAIRVRTANGSITTYLTRIESMTIGSIQLENIRAIINPKMTSKDEILLGMSALKKLEMRQIEGKLHLIQN